MDVDTETRKKRHSRKHTKEERKLEKKRYRERKKLLKKELKNDGVPKADKAVQEQGVQTHNMNASKPPPNVQYLMDRGMKMVSLSGKQLAKQMAKPKHRRQEIGLGNANPAKTSHVSHKSFTVINRDDLTQQDKDDIIGSGSYGVCYKGFYRGNIPVVIMIKAFRNPILQTEVTHESSAIQDLQRLEHHPSLPLLFGVNLQKVPFLLVTQLHGSENNCTYTLSKAVKDKLDTNNQWIDVLIQIVRTVGYIHSRGWLHNDLKENNIVLHLVDGQWSPVIIDFGKSVRIKEAKARFSSKQKDPKKYPWIAPEVLNCRSAPSAVSDIYSMGFIIRYIITVAMRIKEADFLFTACISRAPEERPKNAQTVAVLLTEFKKKHLL